MNLEKIDNIFFIGIGVQKIKSTLILIYYL